MKRILVPCDFSATSIEAFKFAVAIVQQSGGELHVLHVLDMTFLHGSPSLSHSYTFNAQFLRDMEKETDEKFQTMWEQFSPLTLAVKFHHQVGSLIPETEKYIDENHIDLVLMGTSGTNRSKWGSNIEKIVRYSPVPVIAIRKNPAMPVRKIVVPVSLLGVTTAKFIEELRKLQLFFDAQLQLLYINTPLFFQKDRSMQTHLEEFARRFELTNYGLFFRSDTTVQEGIAHFIKETHADMIAMGTHAWKGLSHFLLGSITEDVVNELQIPTWSYVVD